MAVPTHRNFDAVIAGSGPTGLCMALSLVQMFAGDIDLALIDPHSSVNAKLDTAATPPHTSTGDPRAWALSAASIRLLTALGVWPAIKSQAQPVTEIEITDSPLNAGIRPVLLSYDNRTAAGEPAAYIVPGAVLVQALRTALRLHLGKSITVYPQRFIQHFAAGSGGITAALDDTTELHADLIIAADGRASALREQAGIKSISWPYDQVGIVTTVQHERPHGGKAVQHFLPGGPFAILPLPGNTSCITWSEASHVAETVLALDDAGFLAEVQRRFGGRLGPLQLAGGRGSFPLSMHLARTYVQPGFALIGDAAHAVHPIAGQGLNLAFRDVAALAECIADGVRSGMSFGAATSLERYQAWRRFDTTVSAGTFDAINRLFSNENALLRSAREVGLGVVDRVPELKRFFVKEASGLSGDLPSLMR